MSSLSSEEIGQRLIKLRNFEQLYPKARERIEILEKENKELKTVNVRLQVLMEKFRLRIE